MYNWRKISEKDRADILKERKVYRRPWHAPPHFEYNGVRRFLVTAACFEHKHIIGKSVERLAECESELLAICDKTQAKLFAWCVLSNHYHLLVEAEQIRLLLEHLGKYHGASSYKWNGEDNNRGRKVWFRSVERSMRSERHYLATLNYIHHNPIKHGYVSKWQDWPFSSAREYLENVENEKALEVWREYPVLNYGNEWDND